MDSMVKTSLFFSALIVVAALFGYHQSTDHYLLPKDDTRVSEADASLMSTESHFMVPETVLP